jgi:hypothetical protein
LDLYSCFGQNNGGGQPIRAGADDACLTVHYLSP